MTGRVGVSIHSIWLCFLCAFRQEVAQGGHLSKERSENGNKGRNGEQEWGWEDAVKGQTEDRESLGEWEARAKRFESEM